MGVDLQTYRAKIGTFRNLVGLDVVTVVCIVNFSRGLKTTGSLVFIGLLLLIAGIEQNPGPKEGEVKDAKHNPAPGQGFELQEQKGYAQSKHVFDGILKRLGLSEKFPSKIALQDVISIDPFENEDESMEIKEKDLPWLLLRRLVTAHSEARDITCTITTDAGNQTEPDDVFSLFSSSCNDYAALSPLDVVFVVFQCCDPILKQTLFQKLYLCKLAVPFLYIDLGQEVQQPTLSIWPLRSLAIEIMDLSKMNGSQRTEFSAAELPTKLVSFARFGRPQYSKSQLLNNILSSRHGCSTFFNFDCPSGMTPRTISNGNVEMFWLPTIGEKKDNFPYPITFLNMRGDLHADFSESIVSLLAKIVDTVVIVVDILSLKTNADELANLVSNYRSVILIIASKLQHQDISHIHEFQKKSNSKEATQVLKILSTYKKNNQLQNVIEMVSTVSNTISVCLNTENCKSIEQRILHANFTNVKSDEDNELSIASKKDAILIFEELKKEGDPNKWKHIVTPVQSIFSRKLGKLLKQYAREKSFEEMQNISKMIKETRYQQRHNIKESFKCFVHCLIKHSHDNLQLDLFLGWLKLFIENEKRVSVPQLMEEYRCASQRLKQIKTTENSDMKEFEDQELRVREMEQKIDDASFSLDHLFREISHVYDALLETEVDSKTVGLPVLEKVKMVITKCLIRGHQFELIDGESFYMPHKWIACVFECVENVIGFKKFMTLSVLGLQSSGKSTLLNIMFGSQFPSRTGKCTRGIHMQLIPLKQITWADTEKTIPLPYDFLALIDTEGLRSPELSHIKHEHDNELATVITGLGDITLLNIMGENTSEIKDILQVIVHAFLRLKRTNPKLDIRKSCCFIHQNVTDASASDNMMSGLSKLLQNLNDVTKESAKSEGLLEITHFNQLLEFDINTQVWYLKHLWQGISPMTRINCEYSNSVRQIKINLIQKALSMKEKSYKSLQDLLIQGHSLWQGVLNEDFVFSFRNNLEIKAYTEMEANIHSLLWKFEQKKILVKLAGFTFAGCNDKDKLKSLAKEVETTMLETLNYEKVIIEEELDSYFENSCYKDTIIQWKQAQKIRLENLCLKLENMIRKKIDKSCEKRAVEILTVSYHSKHEEELWQMSIDVANKNKGRKLKQEQKDELFEEIWKSFLTNVETTASESHISIKGLEREFVLCLYNIFNTEKGLVKQYLGQCDFLNTKPIFKRLGGSFNDLGIEEDDVTFLRRRKGGIPMPWKSKMHHVEKHTEELFLGIDDKILSLKRMNEEISEVQINEFLHDLLSRFVEISKCATDFIFRKTFLVKLFIHVSNFSVHVFNEHNVNHYRDQGVQARITTYKKQQKITFEAHLNNRQSEDYFASLIGKILEDFVREKTYESISTDVTDHLYSKIPNVKNQVILSILQDLVACDDFDQFLIYIQTPKRYAVRWLTQECNKVLFSGENSGYSFLGQRLAYKFFASVEKCMEILKLKYIPEKNVLSVHEFIVEFSDLLRNERLVISQESFRIFRQETGYINNIEYLSNTILTHILVSKEKIINELKRITEKNVLWKEFDPVDRIIDKIWGCPEQCEFCGEPCAKTEDHQGSDHYTLQHRLPCCRGTRNSSDKRAWLTSCNFNVQSNLTYKCIITKFLCNRINQEECFKKSHKYRDYKEFIKSWDIPPSTDMYQSSKYWLWFVAKYKHELEDRFDYILDKIPTDWEEITKEQAIQSIKSQYTI